MANASYIQDSFGGGEKSQLAQGRITDREYRTWLNVCVNGHPTEAGGWVRRPGTMYAGHTLGGRPARVIKFDFAAATPYTMEFTDSFIRFRQGAQLATTNDAQQVFAISSANPAVVQISGTPGWVSGDTVMFSDTGAGIPRLQNRQVVINPIDSTHFSIFDPFDGSSIDGSTIGPLIPGTMVSHIQTITSPYVAGTWKTVRSVQAEESALLLNVNFSPRLLTVNAQPIGGLSAQFGISNLTFFDGPYLDPFTNGVMATPNALKGNVTLSLSFPAFDSGTAYKKGDFVTSAGVNYESLVDNNVGNTPVSSPSDWVSASAFSAFNNGKGLLGSDIGRQLRLFSEPDLWNSSAAYAVGAIVSYNPTGLPNEATYWTSLTGPNTGNIPGNDVTNWQLATNAALWSWGTITGFVNQISQIGTGVVIGDLIQNGGIAAAFDGITSQTLAQSAAKIVSTNGTFLSVDGYVGKNYSGGAEQIGGATVFATEDFSLGGVQLSTVAQSLVGQSVTVSLRAKATVPLSPSDGTLLAQVTNPVPFQSVSLISNDQNTAWNFVWIEIAWTATITNPTGQSVSLTSTTAEVQFFNPVGSTGNAIEIEILGAALLYTTPIRTWRIGAYSNTTSWPTCGCYHQGRLWLAGAIGNRFDASVSNGLVGTALNMAPTDQNGVVGAANGISGTVNSDGVNPIFWLTPDLQGIIMGTQSGEWLISAPSPGAITGTNIEAVRVTRIGCSFIEPRKTDHTTVFVQRYAKKVMEYFTDVYSGKFSAPNLAKDAMHITKPLVAELAYTQANIPIVWGRNNDGSWWGATYKRDTLATSTGPTINGWHRHSLGSGRTVQSIAAGPSVGGDLDALSLVTLDSSTGIYHVEVMTDAVDEGDTLLDATYLDDAVNPTSVVSSTTAPAPYGGLTINGLWHLNGKTATAWLGGLDCGDYVVANGSITVPYGDGISAGTANGLFTAVYAATLPFDQMLVGFTFTSQGQIVRPATPQESGARNGPAVGKVRRNHKIAAQFEGTGVGVSVGTTFAKVDPVKFRLPNDTAYLINQQFTGIYKDTLTDTFSYDGMVCWQVTRPYPCNIANLGGFIETTDE